MYRKHLKVSLILGRVMYELNIKNLSKCIHEQEGSILVNIEVKPGSKTSGIEKIDEWRGFIEVRVKARAEKGKANKELVQLLSSIFALPQENIIIVKGEKSKRKNIKILGLKKDDFIRRLKF